MVRIKRRRRSPGKSRVRKHEAEAAGCFEMWGGGGGCHRPLCHAHAPTQIFSNALCVVRWHKQTSLQSSVSSVSNGFVTMHQLSVVQAFLHHGAS